MTKYVWGNGQWLDTTGWKPPPRKTPYIIRDTMDALVNHADGRIYDSKRAFSRATREAGYVEVGNDCLTSPTSNRLGDLDATKDIAQAIQQLEQGYQPPPVESLSDWGGETRVIE